MGCHLVQTIRNVQSTSSYRPISKTYRIDLDHGPPLTDKSSYTLTIEPPVKDFGGVYHRNPLSEVSKLVALVDKERRDDMGVNPEVIAFDDSLAIIPYNYLLQPQAIPDQLDHEGVVIHHVSLTEARTRLPEEQIGVLHLMMGRMVAAYNSIRNPAGWFGLPQFEGPPPNGSHSWRETFVRLITELLQEVETLDERNPERLQGLPVFPFHLARIKLALDADSGIFDDVHVPQLVVFPTWEDDAIAAIVASHDDSLPLLVGINPRFDYALWADPLLEATLLPSKSSSDVLDGYGKFLNEHKEGTEDVDFEESLATERTFLKRIWYEVFFHLFILADNSEEDSEKLTELKKDSREWALEMIRRMMVQMQEAGLLD